MFRKVSVHRISDTAVQEITATIREGKLRPGQQLPSERDLMKQLGLSRATLREALRVLEALGILEVRPGKGTFVSPQFKVGVNETFASSMEFYQDQVLDLLEVRAALESHLARKAAQRAGEADLAAMEQAMADLEAALETGNAIEASATDLRFHLAVAAAAHSPLVEELLDGTLRTMYMQRLAVFSIPGRGQISVQQHRQVVAAIRVRDPDSAARAVSEHLDSVAASLLSRKSGPVSQGG